MRKEKKKVPAGSGGKDRKRKKNYFRRFRNFMTFLILVAFGGFVFYRGWVQFSIPENHYALVFTKTGGYDNRLLEPGRFVWRWENLFPTNMTLHFFELPWEDRQIDLDGALPSGREYGTAIGSPEAFDYSVSAALRYRMDPDYLPSMLTGDGFRSSMISDWYEDVPGEFRKLLLEELGGISGDAGPDDLPGLEDRAVRMLEGRIPGLEVGGIRILSGRVPDRMLYEEARRFFLARTAAIQEHELSLEKRTAEAQSSHSRKMLLLEDYGKVLTEYPVLLDYFSLDREKLDPEIFTPGSSGQKEPES